MRIGYSGHARGSDNFYNAREISLLIIANNTERDFLECNSATCDVTMLRNIESEIAILEISKRLKPCVDVKFPIMIAIAHDLIINYYLTLCETHTR